MTRKFAALLALVFMFSIGQAAFGQNSNTSTTMKSGRAERHEERGEERHERRKHRRHRRGHRRHSDNTTGNANH